MSWKELENCFHRAITYTFSKKRIFLTFSALVLCGLLMVFGRALSFNTSDWIAMSLVFLPILLSSGILLSLGVVLIRMYSHEVKKISLSWKRLVTGSIDLILGTLYLSIPPVFVYLLLWMGLGLFYLLGEIPGIGTFFSIVLAFGPFLLILSSLLLCLANLILLFFVAPALAVQPFKRGGALQRLAAQLRGQFLTGAVLFLVALIPILLTAGLLSFSAMLTHTGFAIEQKSLSMALEWFFIMLPFCALLTPSVIFFFHFAAESYWLLQHRSPWKV